MCAPALSMVAGLATAGLQAGAQMSAANADYAAKSAAWVQNVVNSEAAARDDHNQILTQQLQEQNKTVQKKHISHLEEAQKSSAVEVSAAQGNVEGASVDNLLRDIAGKSALNRTYADENYKYIVANTQTKLHASDTTLQSRINSVQRPVEPSPLAALAGFAGAGAKAFGSLSSDGGSLGGLSFGD